MKYIQLTDEHKVYSQWLKSELYRVRKSLLPSEIVLIESPNLQSSQDNMIRKDLLRNIYTRAIIIDSLPPNIIWHEVIIESGDIDKMYILPTVDWFMDTGKTFRVKDTISNLAPNRGYNLSPTLRGNVSHYQKIKDMSVSGNTDYSDIVIVSSGFTDNLYTIIDGTHRSTFLYKNNRLVGTRAFLGIANDLSGYMWSIERASITNDLRELKQFAEAGMFW